MCRKYFQKWYSALIRPKETFKAEKKNASLSGAVKNIGLAGLIGGIIAFLIFQSADSIVLAPILLILFLFIISGITYLTAKLLGGKGDFRTQMYIFSLSQPQILIINAFFFELMLLIENISRGDTGALLAMIAINNGISIYSLYLLTLALKETHEYSTGKAVAAWILPTVIIAIILILFHLNIWQLFLFLGCFISPKSCFFS